MIREARAGEASVLAAAYEWLFAPPGIRPPGWEADRARTRLERLIGVDDATMLVSDVDDGIVGICSVYLDVTSVRFGQRAWVEDLAVHPDHRSAGHGKALLDAAKEWGRSRGATHLELDSGEARASYALNFQFRAPTGLVVADSGDVTGPLYAIDLRIPSTGGSTSGCEATDFPASVPAGSIALIQRGTCDFVLKIQNAINAGFAAVVLFNEGNAPDRMGLNAFNPATTGDLPVLAATFAVGQELANGVTNGPTGTQGRVKVDIVSEQLPTRNVIAETPGDDENVVVVGAHLDSVEDGPGVNDNGSGSAAILEIAEEMRRVRPRNQVRFIWFSAEESGLLGSEHYVNVLPQEERDKIAAMLNFDMLASPNFVRFVYDGDTSAFPPPPEGAPPGSGAIEAIFADYFASRGLASAPTAFSGRSDYRAFIAQGIPAGGLFTGAEGIKTAAEAATFGGAVGEQYDPCYHAFCDTLGTLVGVPPAVAMLNPATDRNTMRFNGMRGFDQMADAAAHATITLAQSTEAVNGGQGNAGAAPAARLAAAEDDEESHAQ